MSTPPDDGLSGKEQFVLKEHEPAYFQSARDGTLENKLEAALRELEDCSACPRSCHVDRLRDAHGFCRTGRHALVSSAGPHLGEEDCLRGWRGSGTIFFGSCNLRCVFCQNFDISQRRAGTECTGEEIAAIMLSLQERGCHNINLVTPEHVVPQMAEAIVAAVRHGLRLPIVYNTSGYDCLRSLRLMEGLVDIYMPDFKFWKTESARDFLKAEDYPERARDAILEMHRQVGPLKFGEDGLARRGVLIRYLVMPGGEDEAASIFDWLAREVSPDTFVNVMGQYHPDNEVGGGSFLGFRSPLPGRAGSQKYPSLNRRLRPGELEAAYDTARRAGLWRFDTRHLL